MPKSVGVRGDLLVNSGIVYLRLYIELFRVFLSLLESHVLIGLDIGYSILLR
jgi:hypothetical protein